MDFGFDRIIECSRTDDECASELTNFVCPPTTSIAINDDEEDRGTGDAGDGEVWADGAGGGTVAQAIS